MTIKTKKKTRYDLENFEDKPDRYNRKEARKEKRINGRLKSKNLDVISLIEEFDDLDSE